MHQHQRLRAFAAWGIAYVAAYTMLGVPDYEWYRLSVQLLTMIFFAVGLAGRGRWVAARMGRGGVAVASGVLLVIVPVAALARGTIDFLRELIHAPL